MTLRIHADPASVSNDVYWSLRHSGKLIDDVAETLGLYEGVPVIIYYADEEEEFEWDGNLYRRPTGPPPAPQWVAVVDEASFRRIR
jgi:hypothetical protein